MPDPDLTLAILREIRAKLDDTNTRMDVGFATVVERLSDVEDRLSDVETTMAGFGDELVTLIRHVKTHVHRDIKVLDNRVTSLERKGT